MCRFDAQQIALKMEGEGPKRLQLAATGPADVKAGDMGLTADSGKLSHTPPFPPRRVVAIGGFRLRASFAHRHSAAPPRDLGQTMAGYKDLDFNERRAASQKARDEALAKLRARAPVDPAEQARRRAAGEAREAAKAARRAAAALASTEQARAKAEDAAAAAKAGELTEQERKAARDERYAARKKKARR